MDLILCVKKSTGIKLYKVLVVKIYEFCGNDKYKLSKVFYQNEEKFDILQGKINVDYFFPKKNKYSEFLVIKLCEESKAINSLTWLWNKYWYNWEIIKYLYYRGSDKLLYELLSKISTFELFDYLIKVKDKTDNSAFIAAVAHCANSEKKRKEIMKLAMKNNIYLAVFLTLYNFPLPARYITHNWNKIRGIDMLFDYLNDDIQKKRLIRCAVKYRQINFIKKYFATIRYRKFVEKNLAIFCKKREGIKIVRFLYA